MRARLKKCILTSAAILCVGCAYAVFVRLTGLGIPCPFHLITGLNCPGCGVSRMLLSLLRLDLKAAFHYNAVLLCLLPVLAGLGIWRACRYVRLDTRKGTPLIRGTELALVGILMIWGVVRNLIGM